MFLVKAFNGDDIIDSITSALGQDSTLDSKPWIFGFSGLSDITKIEISFIGSKEKGIGLAFNNFSPTQDLRPAITIHEPSSIALFLVMTILLYFNKFVEIKREYQGIGSINLLQKWP